MRSQAHEGRVKPDDASAGLVPVPGWRAEGQLAPESGQVTTVLVVSVMFTYLSGIGVP